MRWARIISHCRRPSAVIIQTRARPQTMAWLVGPQPPSSEIVSEYLAVSKVGGARTAGPPNGSDCFFSTSTRHKCRRRQSIVF